MRRAGLVVHDALTAVQAAIKPGVTTYELDRTAAAVIAAAGARPSFLGYGEPPFPGVVCASVNSEVVHGVPGPTVLATGDLVSIDCGAIVEGWHGDAAFTAVVGGDHAADDRDRALLGVTEEALWQGIAALRVGGRLGEVANAIDDHVTDDPAAGGRPWGLVEGYTGHGIGTAMHEPPEVLNHRSKERGIRVKPGLCVAVEPMVTAGSAETRELADGWTVVTMDGGRAAHFEHTVAVLHDGLWVLTAPDGGAERLRALGAKVSSAAAP